MLRRIVALMLLLAAASPAPASHPYGCGGTWDGPRGCAFEFRGFPLTVDGDAFRASGTARVRVWITLQQDPTETVLLECAAEGRGEISCDGAHDAGSRIDLPSREVAVMLCRVEGRGSGSYYCESIET